MTAYNSSSKCLVVKWSHLPEKNFQGQPIGYHISYYSVESQGDINFVNKNFKLNTTILTNLTVYTMYVINVSAVSSGGIGPAKTVKARTDAEGKFLILADKYQIFSNSFSFNHKRYLT